MPITRTPWIDDDGSGTTGTVINNAEKQLLYDQIDAALAGVSSGLIDAVPATRVDTGTVNNWAPGLIGNTFTRWNGAADLNVTGLAGGVAGQRWTFKNVGTKVAFFYHANSGSVAGANQFVNAATSAPTPVGPTGWIAYEHDGVAWYLVDHCQGSWVSAPYAAASFRTAASPTGWTVTAGQLTSLAYYLDGRVLDVAFTIDGSTVSANTVELNIMQAAYGGFTGIAVQYNDPIPYSTDAGAQIQGSQSQVNASGGAIRLLRYNFVNWSAPGPISVYGKVRIGVV